MAAQNCVLSGTVHGSCQMLCDVLVKRSGRSAARPVTPRACTHIICTASFLASLFQVVYDFEPGAGNTQDVQPAGAGGPHMDYRLYLVQVRATLFRTLHHPHYQP